MKNKVRFKQIISAVLAMTILLIPLTACGGKDKNEGLSEYVYIPRYTSVNAQVNNMSSPYLSGDKIYFISSSPTHSDGTPLSKEELDSYYGVTSASNSDIAVETTEIGETANTAPVLDYSEITYKTAIYSIDKDGNNYQMLKDYKQKEEASDKYSYSRVDKLIVDNEGNIWVSETIERTIFDLPEGFDSNTQDPYDYYTGSENKTYIRKLSNTGAELTSIDLSQVIDSSDSSEMSRYYMIDGFIIDKSGNVFVSDGYKTVYVLDDKGNLSYKLTTDNYLNHIIELKDGTIGVITYVEGSGSVFRTIDTDAKKWGQDLKLPPNVWHISSGGNVYDFCYSESASLFGYNASTETNEKILSWINSDIDSDSIRFSTILENGDVFAVSENYDNEGGVNLEIINLVKTPRSEVKEKTTLTFATMYLDYNLKKEIIKFNKTNEDFRIEVIDYSEYNTDEDYYAGITKLNTEIISGKVPDLIDISQLPYQQYASKGLLEDLYTYIDKDDEISRDDFVPSILKASEIDGKLYQLATSFYVYSLIGATSVVGNEMGWTMDDMQAIIDAHPEADYPFGAYMTRENVLYALCMLNINSYMDWHSGKCSFNSDDFKKLLTFAKSFPETMSESEDGGYFDDSTMVQDGRQLFEIFSLYDFQDYQYCKARFGGEITFKGFPTEDKKGNVAMLNGGISMTTSCRDKDGAWKFMRTFMSDKYQESLPWHLPMKQKAFDKKLAEAMKQEYYTDENGNKVPAPKGGFSIGDGQSIEFYALTKQEADQIKTLINSVEYVTSINHKIIDIITEEATYFFSGEKTVDDTADIIQSRMTIYINEQR